MKKNNFTNKTNKGGSEQFALQIRDLNTILENFKVERLQREEFFSSVAYSEETEFEPIESWLEKILKETKNELSTNGKIINELFENKEKILAKLQQFIKDLKERRKELDELKKNKSSKFEDKKNLRMELGQQIIKT